MFLLQLQQIPSQEFNVVLENQNCFIKIYQKDNKTFSSLSIDNKIIWQGILCHSFINLKPFNYLDFKGVLVFVDLFGKEDPDYTQYNTRFQLLYMSEEEYANLL